MTYYNLALLASDFASSQIFIQLAQENFIIEQNQYILGQDAVPHITLCQFRYIETDTSLIWQLVVKEFADEYRIKFDGMYLKFDGEQQNEEYIWAGLSIKRDIEILNLQSKIHQLLSTSDCSDLSLTGEFYFPHLTFARINYRKDMKILKYPDSCVFTNSYSFKASLGLSNENGVYQQVKFTL